LLVKITEEFPVFVTDHVDAAWLTLLFDQFSHFCDLLFSLGGRINDEHILVTDQLVEEVFDGIARVFNIPTAVILESSLHSSVIEVGAFDFLNRHFFHLLLKISIVSLHGDSVLRKDLIDHFLIILLFRLFLALSDLDFIRDRNALDEDALGFFL
jgi:hypothetical protein